MKATIILLIGVVLITSGCASSIVTGEGVRTSSTVLKSKDSGSEVSIFMIDSNIDRPYEEIGLVFSRAWVFEKGLEELKNQARKLGADAVVKVKYERKVSVDYLQDLYHFEGKAALWKK